MSLKLVKDYLLHEGYSRTLLEVMSGPISKVAASPEKQEELIDTKDLMKGTPPDVTKRS